MCMLVKLNAVSVALSIGFQTLLIICTYELVMGAHQKTLKGYCAFLLSEINDLDDQKG